MKFLLTSSGINNDDIALSLSSLVGKPLKETNILFVPTAANTEGEDKRWLIGNLTDLQKYNFKSIDILDIAAVSSDVWKKRFMEKDVICFGGGNEKYLAEIFDTGAMKDFLQELSDTKVYVGISAGSMVTGNFMPHKLYPSIFPEETFGEGVQRAMGLHHFCFIPHLNSNYFAHVRKENLERLKDDFTTDVYSTDDETALQINGTLVTIVGKGNYWINKKL